MKIVSALVPTVILGAAYLILRRKPDPHAEARDLAYETWCRLSNDQMDDECPPQPSAFTSWRATYSEAAIIHAVVAVARSGRLSRDRVSGALLRRAIVTTTRAA